VRLENFIVRALSSNSTINAFAPLIVNTVVTLCALRSRSYWPSYRLTARKSACSGQVRLSDKVQSTDLKHRPSSLHTVSRVQTFVIYAPTDPQTQRRPTSIHYQIHFSHNAVFPRYETSVRPRSGDCPIRNPIEEGTM
jgi:hypothetical protein